MDDLLATQKEDECKGLVFVYTKNYFFSKAQGIYQTTDRLKILKRKSCKGCGRCDCIKESLGEDVGSDIYPIMPEMMEHGKHYGIRFINLTTDWETGYVDDYDLEFYPLDKTT